MEDDKLKNEAHNTENNSQQKPNNYYSANKYGVNYEERRKRIQQKKEQGKKEFAIFGMASIIYALIFTVCLYKNLMGITNVIWVSSTITYNYYIVKKLGGHWRRVNTFYSAILILLGFSNFITGNSTIVFFNYVAMFGVNVLCVVDSLYEINGINITKSIGVMLEATFGALGEVATPFKQASAYLNSTKKEKRKKEKAAYVIIGILITIPVILFILSLLVSADAIFAEVFSYVAEYLSLDIMLSNIIGIVITFLLGYTVPYMLMKNISNGKLIKGKKDKRTGEPIIAVIVTAAVSVIYVLFSFIQIVYLFMGAGTLPEDYTYAQYAREGFFQLLFVCLLNMVIAVVASEFFRESKILKIITTIICGCTYIMLASSAYRMIMYIKTYGLTFLRVIVLWMLLVIGILMVGIIIQIYDKTFSCFKFSVAVVSVCYLVLSFSHVDYFIAKYDLNFYDSIKKDNIYIEGLYQIVDYKYLSSLSTDALPAIAGHNGGISEFVSNAKISIKVKHNFHYYKDDEYWLSNFKNQTEDFNNRFSIRKFNVSRYIGSKILN